MNINNIISIVGIVFVIVIMIYFIYSIFFEQYQENMTVIGPSPALAAVNTSGNIFSASKGIKFDGDNAPEFTQLSGAFTNISCSNGQLYGISNKGNIFYSSNLNGEWKQIQGSTLTTLSQVSFDGYNMIVIGINGFGELYYANKNITTTANWTKIAAPSGLVNVSYSNNQIVGVDGKGAVWYLPQINDSNLASINLSNWTTYPISYKIKQVNFDGYNGTVVGVNNNGEIMFCRNILSQQFVNAKTIDNTVIPLTNS